MEKLKLNSLDTKALHHAEFGQFIDRLLADIAKANLTTSEDMHLHELIEQLKTKVPTYNKALEQIRENENTKKLAEIDKERDNDFKALRDSIKPYKNAKKENQKQAYDILKIIFDEYKNITNLSYEEETKKVSSLITTLKSEENKPHISTLKISEFIDELEKTNTAFDTLFGVRSAQNIAKETYDTKAIRKEKTEIYRKLTNYILTMADIKQDEFYKKALDVVNNSRKYYADTLAKRSGVSKSKKEDKTEQK